MTDDLRQFALDAASEALFQSRAPSAALNPLDIHEERFRDEMRAAARREAAVVLAALPVSAMVEQGAKAIREFAGERDDEYEMYGEYARLCLDAAFGPATDQDREGTAR